jgi:hypothetical protein
MRGGTILAVYSGINAVSSDGSSDLISVVDTHINCRKYGIYAINWRRVKFRGQFILMGFSQAGDSPTYGIYNRMNNGAGQDGDVSNNNISYENVAGVVSTRIGIECSINANNMYTNVSDNIVRQATTAYTLAASCFASNNNSY